MADATAPDAYARPFTPRFYEIDGQGVMFNMWYLGYVDEAMDGYLTHRGMPYAEWAELGLDVHLAHFEIDWRAPVRARDGFEVAVTTARIGKRSFTLDFAFRRGGEATATGSVVYVVVATDGSGPAPLPGRLVAALSPVAPLRGEETS
ncbi:MAG TPA: thioesterase family protein [Nonomuraea sp.]|nr:thioesterase family protein [Nonomuraea sp.]